MTERRRASEQAARHRAQPFPGYSIISSVLTEVLNLKGQDHIPRLNDDELIWGLPLVHQHMRNLAKSCTCKDCENGSESSSSLDFGYSNCEMKGFMSRISLYTADILAISLFEDPHKLSVSYRCIQESDRFQLAIRHILESGERTECTPQDVLYYALKLVGHKEFDGKFDHDRWVISCYKGQAVYPKVFETGNICQPGYLTLCWAPGLLYFDGEKYDMGIDDLRFLDNRLKMASAVGKLSRPVTEPLSLHPDTRSRWKVTSRDGYLAIHLSCGLSIRHPSVILSNLAYALVINCPHDKASPLPRPDPNSRYVDLYSRAAYGLSTSNGEEHVDVLGVDGNTNLRMFAMSALKEAQMSFAIRRNACLQCCLDLCRKNGSHYLIC